MIPEIEKNGIICTCEPGDSPAQDGENRCVCVAAGSGDEPWDF